MLCHRVYCILICSHHTHCSRIDNENIIIKKGSKGTSSVLEGVTWWPICPRFLLVCVTKYRMMERKIMSKNKIIWTYCTLNRHKNQAGWLRCLLHLRKGSVSTLLSRRAAGQTERGFPTHTQSLRTLIGSDWKPDRQTDQQRDILLTLIPFPPQSPALRRTHFRFLCRAWYHQYPIQHRQPSQTSHQYYPLNEVKKHSLLLVWLWW